MTTSTHIFRIAIWGRRIAAAVFLAMFMLGIVGQFAATRGQAPHAEVVDLEMIIHPIAERYLDRSIERATASGAHLVIIEIDTPGGLLTSTREMVTDIFASPIPIVVYVAPAGSRAASAGTFITAAGHIAAMAPGTNIGAASPVSGDGSEISETLKDKIFEDTAAEMRSIAQRRGRPQEPLEATVLEAKAYTAQEALDLGIIDVVADSVADLLRQIDGKQVTVTGPLGERTITLDTDGIIVERHGPGLFDQLLAFVADPNISFLLISLGGVGLMVELWSGGSLIFPGVLGLLLLILGFYALGNLPGNWAGAALILIGFALAVAEITVDGFGLLGILGAVAFVLGGIVLFGFFGTPSPTFPDIRVSPSVLASAGAVAGAGAILIAVGSFTNRKHRSGHRRVTTLLVGETATVATTLNPDGKVRVHGEMWDARAAAGAPIKVGTHVAVVNEEGALLTVESIQEPTNDDQRSAHSEDDTESAEVE